MPAVDRTYRAPRGLIRRPLDFNRYRTSVDRVLRTKPTAAGWGNGESDERPGRRERAQTARSSKCLSRATGRQAAGHRGPPRPNRRAALP